MNPLLDQFLQEARENLKYIEQNLEKLDSGDDELINSIFRAAHTLKGGSGIVGFEAVKRITHRAEDLLDMLRARKIAYQDEMLEALYDAFDEVVNLIEAAEQNEDIVDADRETEERVIERLSLLMGQPAKEEVVFSLPFRLLDDKSLVLDMNLSDLVRVDEKIPFVHPEINEENLEARRLYGIVFDVTEDCMLFGNDPVYVLSLLEQGLISVRFALTESAIKDVLSGFQDEEGTKLYAQIMAVAYASYPELEEALYNFIDDLLITPLDISSLLSLDVGESRPADLMVDLVRNVNAALHDMNVEEAANVVSASLGLLNPDSKEARMLTRFLEVRHLVYPDDSAKLFGFFKAVQEGRAFHFVPDEATPEPESVVSEAAATESSADSPVTESADIAPAKTEKEIHIAHDILNQQLEQLRTPLSEEALARIHEIIRRTALFLEKEFTLAPEQVAMTQWLSECLGKPTESVSVKPAPSAAGVQPAPSAGSKPQAVSKPATEGMAKTESKPEPKKEVIGKVVKIDQESIDHLMSVVGELLVAKNSLPYLAESVIGMDSESIKRAVMEKYSFINRLTNQLQDLIMGMRMLPVSYVFDRYPKLVRDISKDLNKKVKLVQDGGETRLDKNMIEVLADPLIHVVRNSLDHGIEIPEERKTRGKPETGQLLMKAYPQSDKVIIEIADDGKGIDIQKIINKVLERELLPIEKIEAMSDEEKLNLILMPGFSMAENITEYSGRGVGMDVVKRSIEGFGGNLEISSTIGVGTTIRLSIPVSLAVTTLLHVSMNDIHYGFPMENVSETVKIEEDEITYLNNEPFIYLREHVIPLLFVRSLLDHDALKKEPLSVVVLNIKGNLLAVVVNELLGQLDVVQKPLDGILQAHPLISGTALLGNGQIIMILDPLGLMGLSEMLKAAKPEEIPEQSESAETLEEA